MSYAVLTCLSRGEADVVQYIDASGIATVVRRCADLAEVLAAASAGLANVAILEADDTITRAAINTLHDYHVAIVLVAEAGDRQRAGSLGADAIVTSSADPDAMAEAVLRLAATNRAPGEIDPAQTLDSADSDQASDDEFSALIATITEPEPVTTADSVPEGPQESAPSPNQHDDDDNEPGTAELVVVWGTPGAPGRTSIALNLAAELAKHASAVLVDADTRAPAITQSLGLLDDTSTIAVLARAAGHGRLTTDVVTKATMPVTVPGTLRPLSVVTGLTRPGRWRELDDASLDAVWETLREVARFVVVDVSATADDADVASFGPARDQATLSALAAADRIIVVGLADPVGIRRLVLTLQDLDERSQLSASKRHVVVNRLRSTVTGARGRTAVSEALQRFANVSEAVIIVNDTATADSALMRGSTWGEIADRSAAHLAVVELSGVVRDKPVSRRLRHSPRRSRWWPLKPQ